DNSIIETVDEEMDIEAEINESSEFRSSIHEAISQIDLCLQEHKVKHNGGHDPNGSLSSSSMVNSSYSDGKKNVRLPKLNLKHFKGDPIKFQAFWDSFETTIHNNEDVSDVSKMSYLVSLLEGPAYRANYKTAVDTLKERFGCEEVVISAHMDALLKLPGANTNSDTKKLRGIYDEVEQHEIGKEKWDLDALQNLSRRNWKLERCARNDDKGKKNDSSQSPPGLPDSPKSNPTATVFSDTEDGILLQTATAPVCNPRRPEKIVSARILFDSGSQKTYISKRLKDALGLSPLKSDRLIIKTFGTAGEMVKTCEEVQGKIYSTRRGFRDKSNTVETTTLTEIGALSLARLVSAVRKANEPVIPISAIYYWTDSITTLYWIQGTSKEFKQFVENRVAEIRELSDVEGWRHVPGKSNPADLPSRGVRLEDLADNSLCWNGPTWLHESEEHWPQFKNAEPDEAAEKEMKLSERSLAKSDGSTHVSVTQVQNRRINLELLIDPKRYSSSLKLYRVTALVLRFVKILKHNCKAADSRQWNRVTTDEIKEAEVLWFQTVQRTIIDGRKFSQVQRSLGLYSNDSKLLRCKGRISKTDIPTETKNPIILPNYHHLTSIISRECHERVLHNGVQDTLCCLRERFWIVKGRQTVKRVIGKCVTYRKFGC
ncbi:Hypothetical predicted protein, partial [Paramuricea clavata]